MQRQTLSRWLPFATPLVGIVLLAVTFGQHLAPLAALGVVVLFVAVVLAAVSHAEEIAHRVGEILGTLVLAVSVTAIEVGLIVTLMATEGKEATTLARDTVFAAIMIVMTGVVGGSLLINALRQRTVRFNQQGANALLGTLVTLAGLSLVMPTFTSGAHAPTFSAGQLAFSSIAAIVVYGMFVFVQTIRHRWMFVSPEENSLLSPVIVVADPKEDVTETPSQRSLWVSLVTLFVSLVVVVGLAKELSPSIKDATHWLGAPETFVGVIIALLVLAPESLASFKAAARNDMQSSLNLSLGSALASIGLTIPAVAVATIWVHEPIQLGLGPREIVLLSLAAVVSALSFGSGRATVLQATHHLAIFAAFIFVSLLS